MQALLPRVVLHSAVSLDGRIDWFAADIGLYCNSSDVIMRVKSLMVISCSAQESLREPLMDPFC